MSAESSGSIGAAQEPIEEERAAEGAAESAGTEMKMRETSTTALKGAEASRRRGRRAAESDDEGGDDRMDTGE